MWSTASELGLRENKEMNQFLLNWDVNYSFNDIAYLAGFREC